MASIEVMKPGTLAMSCCCSSNIDAELSMMNSRSTLVQPICGTMASRSSLPASASVLSTVSVDPAVLPRLAAVRPTLPPSTTSSRPDSPQPSSSRTTSVEARTILRW